MSAALLKRCSDGTGDGGIERYLRAKSFKQRYFLTSLILFIPIAPLVKSFVWVVDILCYKQQWLSSVL